MNVQFKRTAFIWNINLFEIYVINILFYKCDKSIAILDQFNASLLYSSCLCSK